VASMPHFFSIRDNTRARPEDVRHKFARSTSQAEIERAKHGKDDLETLIAMSKRLFGRLALPSPCSAGAARLP
jgi:hypothetical protein